MLIFLFGEKGRSFPERLEKTLNMFSKTLIPDKWVNFYLQQNQEKAEWWTFLFKENQYKNG